MGLRVGPLVRWCGLLNCVCSAAHRSWGGGILSRDVPVGKTQGYALRVVKAVPHGHRFTPVTQCDVSFVAAGWWVGAVLGCYVPSRPSRGFSPFSTRGGSCTLVYYRLPFRVGAPRGRVGALLPYGIGLRWFAVRAGCCGSWLGWLARFPSPCAPVTGCCRCALGGVVLAGGPGSSTTGRGAVFGEAFCPGGDGRRRGATPWPA